MIDVLLINPQEKDGFFERMPPLGLAYIAAVLKHHEYDSKIVDLEVVKEDIDHWLFKYQPRFLGISGTTHTRFSSFDLAKKAKSYSKDIVTIYGGVHASFTAANTLKRCPHIDYIVRGEGEYTILNLLQALDTNKPLQHVRGITYRENGAIIENPPAPRIALLDELPDPAFDLLDMGQYAVNLEFVNKRAISVITSRGCCARCAFCSASRMFDHRLTTHTGKRILDMIELLFSQYGFQGIKIFDSTLTMQREHILGLCDEIEKRNIHFPWECEIRVGTGDRVILERMKATGCYYVNFGVESASQCVLDTMRKGFTVEQAIDLLELCKRVGLKTKVFFSFGHIDETMKDVERTFDFIERYQDYISTVASGAGIRIYPGTYLEEYAVANGLLPENFEWSLPFEDKRYARILQTCSVPLLIQPQLGFRELEIIALRIYGRRFSGWAGLKRGLSKLTDKNKLKKLMQISRTKLKHILPSRKRT